MSLLKAEPSGAVKSLEELFAIASAMEHEAATRYAEIAVRMRLEGNPSLAEVFERLSADEQGHLDSVAAWSQSAKGQNPDPTAIRWKLPEAFDDEGVATTDPKLLSAYRALSMAVRNEERAFAFWSYVAAHAEAPEIQDAAEAMAHEELGHVSILRRERRNAFHAERRKLRAGPADGTTGKDLAALERHLADLLAPLATRVAPQDSARVKGFADEARRHAQELDQFPIALPGNLGRGTPPDDPVSLAELLTDLYLEAGDALRNEEALARVQALAGRAIIRLAWLRADLPELRRGEG
ncbi:ferritin family protein [Microvirga sp. VF16]|uniref:ferritin-like domain-containing protein n=1 Tax=Microvirga sp. VF16 TaxID=2807101 RepID=UPI00193DC3B5|nr:ferritin family protein [Microvirga sp. VF16]QRM27673.1 ferritin family protein [Microvirga sp. VF16]